MFFILFFEVFIAPLMTCTASAAMQLQGLVPEVIDGCGVRGMRCPFRAILESRSRRAHRHKLYHVSFLTIVDFGWQNIRPRVAPVPALHRSAC